ncbi:Aspartyl/Asparaginyl beta-hydroxylase [mine drainage metagenome]|uniref:Aspartyl/Asparaginyl beta-hydroxylase n=1 Tax=mine drainage metagenome TaxID=410659 RepID=T1A341_9ZZZZ
MIDNQETPNQPWRIEDFPPAELSDQVATLGTGADALVQQGRLAEAETVYRRILEVAPHNVRALTFIAMRAFDTGRYEESAALLQQTIRQDPNRSTLHRNMAFVRLAQGLYGKALESIDRAIALNPDSALNYLHRGVILENLGREADSLESYGRALARDPTLRLALPSLPPRVRALAQRAIGRLAPILHARIDAAWHEVESAHGTPLPERARHFVEILKGIKPPAYEDPHQRPRFLFYPGLGARAWFERGEFGWIRAFESAHSAIRSEFEALDDTFGQSELPARSAHPEHARGQTGSPDWNRVHLYQSGFPAPRILHCCPETFAALKHLPLAQGRDHFPDVTFSTLRSGARLPAHHGQSNVKLTLHLGLVVPEASSLTVGRETRHWRKGRALIFDDSFEQSACNEGPTALTVLVADIWNPALTAIEQELIERVIDAQARFAGEYFG